MLETNIYKELKQKVKTDEKNEQTLTNHQAKLLQQQSNNKATIKSSQDSIDLINKDLAYTWKKVTTKQKVGKKTVSKTKKVWTKRSKPANPTANQKSELQKFNDSLAKAKSSQTKLNNSNEFKQAKRKQQKLKNKTKVDKRNLDKYKSKRNKENQASIKSKVEAQETELLSPKAMLYETEGGSSSVVFIFATSENEDNESTITSYPVDKDENVADHVQNSDKTLSIEGRLMGHTASANVSASQIYNKLLDWRFKGTELTYKSNGSKESEQLNMAHMYNKHFHIQSLQKTQDQPLVDEVKFSMTLKFVYRPQVTATRSKINNKGKKVAKGKSIAPKVITGRRGKTMYDYAKKYHTTVKNLLSMNKSKKLTATSNLAGRKIQVTNGNTKIAKPKTPTKFHRAISVSEIAQKRRTLNAQKEATVNGD